MTQLYTLHYHGQTIPAIGQANKNGTYFILDRRTGRPIFPVKGVPVPTTPAWQHPWPTQPKPATDPLEPQTEARTPAGMTSGPMFTVANPTATLIQPGFETGPEWPAGAFSPRTGYVYLLAGGEEPWVYQSMPQQINTTGSAGTGIKGDKIKSYGLFDALNTATGKMIWGIKIPFKAGITNENIGVTLPTGPIAITGGVDPGKSVSFLFTAPHTPGTYTFFGVGDAQFDGMVGRMAVVP
jgi:hypothetical protein